MHLPVWHAVHTLARPPVWCRGAVALLQEAGSSGASSMDPAQLSAAMHHSAASAHGAEAAAQGAAASQTAAAEQALETGPGLEKV